MTAVSERKWVGPGAIERLNILQDVKTIAIVGASDKLKRASYFVSTYLLSSSTYDVYFVNPIWAEKDLQNALFIMLCAVVSVSVSSNSSAASLPPSSRGTRLTVSA